jgi:hypothetical protein
MKRLGVNTSPHKTHVSKNTYEFAKRWFRDGREITGIQLRGLLEVSSKYHLLYEAIYTLYSRGLHPRRFVSIPNLLISLLRRLNIHARQRKGLSIKIENLHAFRKYTTTGNVSVIENRLKALYPDYIYPLPNNNEDMNHWIRTYIYISVDRIIQRLTAQYLDYHTSLFQGSYFTKFAPALADPYHIWTSPVWLILKSPITQSLINRLRNLSRSLYDSHKNDDVRSLVQVISLPDPSILEQRSAERILGSEAETANRFFRCVDNHLIYNRPPHIDINMQNIVADNAYTKLNTMLMNAKSKETFGLI